MANNHDSRAGAEQVIYERLRNERIPNDIARKWARESSEQAARTLDKRK